MKATAYKNKYIIDKQSIEYHGILERESERKRESEREKDSKREKIEIKRVKGRGIEREKEKSRTRKGLHQRVYTKGIITQKLTTYRDTAYLKWEILLLIFLSF